VRVNDRDNLRSEHFLIDQVKAVSGSVAHHRVLPRTFDAGRFLRFGGGAVGFFPWGFGGVRSRRRNPRSIRSASSSVNGSR
jgi:hypothetical protein